MGKFEQFFYFIFFFLYINIKNEVWVSGSYTRKQKDYQ